MNIDVDLTRKTFQADHRYPEAGSEEETRIFKEIQSRFARQFIEIFPDKLAAKTVVIIPSLTLDQEILTKLEGQIHYEERLLCMLMLLRMPATNLVYVTSEPVDESIVDYYLHLLPGITGCHASQRLTMLSCYDASPRSLTEKILERPRLIGRIKRLFAGNNAAHIACFNSTALEKTLAVRLGIPIYGTDPDLLNLGTKSGSRELFKECGILTPPGFENLKTKKDIIAAIAALKRADPSLRKAVIKMNDGFSGDGNAVYNYNTGQSTELLENTIESNFEMQLQIVAKDLSKKLFLTKFEQMGGIAEAFLDGDITASPSVQCRIDPIGKSEIISTHDQLLGGTDNQVFLGAHFPASPEYATAIAADAKQICKKLALKGVVGRFSIDFISVRNGCEWKNYAIEVNLRKGGTTHPYLMLQFLTDGQYNEFNGEYLTFGGNKRFYFSSDNVCDQKYRGLTPQDLIDIAMFHSLMYNSNTQEGVTFHLVGALSQYGKLGVVCIGSSPERARLYFEKVIEVLDLECDK
ncbi:MAG TPA: peptide ligase PGM1-related protein [Panacibacter sp.]|nr:peptide ligase PGM1-related protein [Panacibacter sp.]HNP47136.1 peptide ligase PGM1-related protein [Panacibacter sp.]